MEILRPFGGELNQRRLNKTKYYNDWMNMKDLEPIEIFMWSTQKLVWLLWKLKQNDMTTEWNIKVNLDVRVITLNFRTRSYFVTFCLLFWLSHYGQKLLDNKVRDWLCWKLLLSTIFTFQCPLEIESWNSTRQGDFLKILKAS